MNFTTARGPLNTLSSLQTFYMKIVFPAVWIGGFTIGTVAQFLSADSKPGEAWTFLLATVVGTFFLWWICMRLKRVRMDDTTLFISNYKTEIAVPLSNVAEVSENKWINIHPVTIRFYSDTEFGSQIVFMPKVRWFAMWSSHPVVAEIRDAVTRATGRGPTI